MIKQANIVKNEAFSLLISLNILRKEDTFNFFFLLFQLKKLFLFHYTIDF